MKIPAKNQVIFIKNVVAVAAYRSCRLWKRVKMSWIHYLLCDHHWTQCRQAISVIQAMSRRYEFWKTPNDLQNATDRMSGRVTWQLYAHEAERALTSCAVTRSNSRSAWVYASLTVSMIHRLHKHPLTPPPPPGFSLSPVSRVSTVWQGTAFSPGSSGQSPVWWSTPGPGSVVDSSLGNHVPAKEIPQIVVVCFLWRTHICRAQHSMRAGMSAVSPKPMLAGTQFSWSAILGEWRHPRIPRQHHRRMRMAVSVTITAQGEGPTWAWFCVAPDVPAGKLWWVAWCAGRLLDHTPNDVAQKPQMCDVISASMGEVRLWRGASYRCWNDDFWLETRAIFSTYRRIQTSPNGIRTLGVMSHIGTLTSCVQLPWNGP